MKTEAMISFGNMVSVQTDWTKHFSMVSGKRIPYSQNIKVLALLSVILGLIYLLIHMYQNSIGKIDRVLRFRSDCLSKIHNLRIQIFEVPM